MNKKIKLFGIVSIIGLILSAGIDSQANPICRPTHRGRIQAQGRNPVVEESRQWAQNTPPTVTDGLNMLDAVWGDLSRSERRERRRAYERARTYIQQVSVSGGAPPGTSRTFQDPQRKDPTARIDIEVISGQAFVLGRRSTNTSEEARACLTTAN